MKQPAALRVALAAAFTLAASALTACDRDPARTAEGNGATVGQKIDKALDRTQQRLAEAGEKTQQKLAAASERIAGAGERAAEGVRDAVTADPKGSDASGASTTTTVTSGPRTTVTGLPSDTRRALGDTAITASIKTDFIKDPDLSVLKIDVDTRDGVVTLNGLAEDEAARKRAEQIAGAIKGVREVRNYLTVKRA